MLLASEDIKQKERTKSLQSEPVWPSGKAEVPRFETASVLLSLQKLWFVDTVL